MATTNNEIGPLWQPKGGFDLATGKADDGSTYQDFLNKSEGYSFSLINPSSGVSLNTVTPSLSSMGLNRGTNTLDQIGNTQANINATTQNWNKVIADRQASKDASDQDTSSATEQAPGTKRMFVSAKKAQRLTDRGKATKVESEHNTDGTQLIEKKKKKFMDTRFGQVLGSTPLGMATRAVVDTVKEGKARRAASKNNNK